MKAKTQGQNASTLRVTHASPRYLHRATVVVRGCGDLLPQSKSRPTNYCTVLEQKLGETDSNTPFLRVVLWVADRLS